MAVFKFIKLNEKAVVPSYGTDFSAGADLYALIGEDKVTIAPNETYLVHTGIAMEIPNGFGGFVFARSGLTTKKGLAPANKVGVIDSDYRGEIMVPLYNHSKEAKTIENGERIAQIVFMPYVKAEFTQVEDLENSERNKGGFGSTGTK